MIDAKGHITGTCYRDMTQRRAVGTRSTMPEQDLSLQNVPATCSYDVLHMLDVPAF